METGRITSEQRIKEYVENYLGKIFYFCLRKTGDEHTAEDLASDIGLSVLCELHRGVDPENFAAWVWQIARNRFCRWAEARHRAGENLVRSDMDDLEISDGLSIENELIHSEDLSLLRRELAFIANDYRQIVIAYYLENRSIHEIAASLHLPEGTVKSKLFRARNILKEGMSMARTFGKRSYQPENISFVATGNQPSGLPWSAVQRSVPKNILLQANNNPSTIDDLSMELGIARPYMEEEVELLVKATLLEKIGDTYVTNFCILDRDTRLEAYRITREKATELSPVISAWVDAHLPEIRSLLLHGEHLDDNTIRWWAIPYAIDLLIDSICSSAAPPPRSNGESWGFIGYEIANIPEETLITQDGSTCNNGAAFWTYSLYGNVTGGSWRQHPRPWSDTVAFFDDCLRNHRTLSSFSENEKKIWENIDRKYAHVSPSGEIIPDVVVLTEEGKKGFSDLLSLCPSMQALYRQMYDGLKNLLNRVSHKILHGGLEFIISIELVYTRRMTVNDLLANGYLQIPDGPDKFTLGMYFLPGK